MITNFNSQPQVGNGAGWEPSLATQDVHFQNALRTTSRLSSIKTADSLFGSGRLGGEKHILALERKWTDSGED